MSVVCICPRTQLCNSCLNRSMETLTSTAWRRGAHWAETVAAKRPELLAREWPALEGRAGELAAGKVADLSEDIRVLERLLVELDTWARTRWEELRRGRQK